MKAHLQPAAATEASRIDEPWGSLRWMAGKEIGGVDLTLGHVIIKPEMCNPRHIHPNCDETLYLLKGRLEHSVGGESVLLEPGDTLTVRAGVAHNAVNIGHEDAEMIVAFNSGVRGFEKVK